MSGILGIGRRAWPALALACGLALLAWPVALDWAESRRALASISAIEETYDAMSDEAAQALWDGAERYDQRLLGHMPEGEVAPYEEQLSADGADMMAHLSIPSLGLELPVYHGTDDNVLMVGVGHVEGTELPVGTRGGRCVLAGHSGMPNARMFDDIRELSAGDLVSLWTLGRRLDYVVTGSEVVGPDETGRLLPGGDDEDLLTLVTCTPYGVNSHRLLVECARTGSAVAQDGPASAAPAPSAYVNRRTAPLIMGLAACAASFAGIALRARARRRAGRRG